MYEPIRFKSTCPKCTAERHQRGVSRATLQRLLWRGLPIEAYCSTCDDFWTISVPERVALAESVAEPAK